jgi:hypothetical protein
MRGAEHRTIQGAAAHPAIGASPAGGTRRSRARNREQARESDARRGRIAQRFSLALRSRPRPRAVVFPTLRLGDGRASSAELRHLAGKPERGRVLQFGVATCVTARDRSPFEAFCSGLPTGVLGRKRRATGQVTVRRGDPKVASRGVPTEVGPEESSGQSRASPRGDARGGRIAQRLSLALRSRPRPRADVFPPCGGGRSSEQRRASSPRRQAGEGTRAPVGVTTCVAASNRSPSRLSAPGHPPGCPTASSGQRGG